MYKSIILIALLNTFATVSFAKPIAKMALICIGDQNQDVIRTIYTTDDNSVLLADPVSQLMLADTVTQPNEDTILIKSASLQGEESLSIAKSGIATLTVTIKAANEAIPMKCYSDASNLAFSMPDFQLK